MQEIQIGQIAPDFSMPATGGQTIKLADLKGKPVVLYFYPKDDTSGCTQEACDFRDNITQFNKVGVTVIGVSKDSLKSHEKFLQKHALNFPLASDEGTDVCERYGVWMEKSMYGKKYMGIERTTFLIDAAGHVAGIWRKVKVDGHVDAVRAALADLKKAA